MRVGPALPSWVLPMAVLAIVGITSMATAQTGTIYVAERDTNCVPCHKDDRPPLKTFTAIQLPNTVITRDPVDYKVTVSFPWTPTKAAYLTYIDASLDLTRAPSLAFSADLPKFTSEVEGLVQVQPAVVPGVPPTLLTRFYSDVQVEVPAGATSLVLTVTPDNPNPATSADITVEVYPGQSNATGTPYTLHNGTTKGSPEAWALEGRDTIAGYGYGNWTLRVIVETAPTGNPPTPTAPTDVSFTAKAESTFAGGAERVQHLPTRERLESGKSRIFTWRLQEVGEPVDGERAVLTFNTTAYHKHDTVQKDWDNATKSYPLDVFAADGGIRMELAPDTDTVIATAQAPTLSESRVGEVVGYVAAILVVSSVISGGMFGKASRRGLNHLFGTARRRVAFHNVLSYGIIAASIGHTVIFLIEAYFHWTAGLIWGGIAILVMFGLGVTGALQIPLIRSWGYSGWRWTHYGMAVAVIVFTLVHMLLDGQNFGAVQQAVGWQDPLNPRLD